MKSWISTWKYSTPVPRSDNHDDTRSVDDPLTNDVNSRQNNRSFDCPMSGAGPGRLCTHGALCSELPNHQHRSTPNRPNVLVFLGLVVFKRDLVTLKHFGWEGWRRHRRGKRRIERAIAITYTSKFLYTVAVKSEKGLKCYY